jgi:hypothetical protein
MTTKILALTDALGNLVRFVLLPGQRFDTVGVPPLIEGLAFDALIADKAFDSNTIIADLDARGASSNRRADDCYVRHHSCIWIFIHWRALALAPAAATGPRHDVRHQRTDCR